MKTSSLLQIILLLTMTAGLTACPVKNRPRQTHEAQKEWKPAYTPVDESVSTAAFATVDTKKMYEQIKSPDAAKSELGILKNLSRFVLNAKFVENAKFRTDRMREMINLFNRAFLPMLDRRDQSPEFLKIKTDYWNTVSAGCSEDLRNGCDNVDLFRDDAYFARIMVRFAQDFDAELEKELAKFKDPNDCIKDGDSCRSLLKQRYSRLAMATGKRNAYEDKEFAFSYMKHARVFALLIEQERKAGKRQGYLAEVHSKIFEAIIMHYDPKNVSGAEFRAFVENFAPWTFSLKKADLFEHGTKKMFEFGSRCCLYTDSSKTQLSDSVKKAIADTQKEDDTLGNSFFDKVSKIPDSYFINMGMGAEIAQLRNLNSSFYNEYFLVVDRLYREHLRPAEIEMILNNAPLERTLKVFPKTIETYLKVYMLDMVRQTNLHMNAIFNRGIDSDNLFNVARDEASQMKTKWGELQTQADQLERAMTGFLRGVNRFDSLGENVRSMVKSINRNIHYLSAYPAMIVMTYFLPKAKGNIVFKYEGKVITIPASSILDGFYDGDISQVWFEFAKTNEALTRQMILYSFEFMLKTDALAIFASDRSKFYNIIFEKYLDNDIYEFRNAMQSNQLNIYGTNQFYSLKAICGFEAGERAQPYMKISLPDLAHFTYAGIGETGALSIMQKFFKDPGDIVQTLRKQTESRTVFVRSMIDLIEKDLERRGQPVKDSPETQMGYAVLKQIEDFRAENTRDFLSMHQKMFDCALRLKEVERRRANRLYEEERKHLGEIFDLMKPLAKLKDPAEHAAKVNELNQTFFRKEGSGYRFDKIVDNEYMMSKYDLLMRMKKRVEADIFMTPTEEEKRLYGEAHKSYYMPRKIKVEEPDALVRDPMITDRIDTQVKFTGDSEADRQSFIDQGMKQLSGQGGSFIDWYGQQREKTFGWYFDRLMEYYFQGPVTKDGKTYEVTAKDIVRTYVRAHASYGMDELDVKNAEQFGSEGWLGAAYYRDKLFEGNGSPLPFFYTLMIEGIGHSGTFLDVEGEKLFAAMQALKFAENEISLRDKASDTKFRVGAFVFDPGQHVSESIKKNYGVRVNTSFQRINDLVHEMEQFEYDIPNLETPSVDKAKAWNIQMVELSRLSLPIFIADGRKWHRRPTVLVDELKARDQKVMLEDFIRRSDNFYGTKETVKIPEKPR